MPCFNKEVVLLCNVNFFCGLDTSCEEISFELISSVLTSIQGFMITLGTLEISTVQNMFTGAVRLVYSVIYSLTLGLAIAIGTNLFTVMNSTVTKEIADYKCTTVHNLNGPWWQMPVSPWLRRCIT